MADDEPGWLPWQQAWQQALYGPDGFYRSASGPAAHFRTAAHASPTLLAGALAELANRAGCAAVIDIGAGRGELLVALHAIGGDLSLRGVDVVERPLHVPETVGWTTTLPDAVDEPTLVVAWELLDVVPCPVLEADETGTLRVVYVRADGRERLGGEPRDDDLAWCREWWPGPYAPGDRVEVGRPREEVWTGLVGLAESAGEGLVLAVDYDHARGGRPPAGTLTGYRAGRPVAPVPDGRCDVTAHVALEALTAPGGRLVRQHEALRWLGVSASRPEPARAHTEALAYLAALTAASEAAELLDEHALGGFGWLLQPVGPTASRCLSGLPERRARPVARS